MATSAVAMCCRLLGSQLAIRCLKSGSNSLKLATRSWVRRRLSPWVNRRVAGMPIQGTPDSLDWFRLPKSQRTAAASRWFRAPGGAGVLAPLIGQSFYRARASCVSQPMPTLTNQYRDPD